MTRKGYKQTEEHKAKRAAAVTGIKRTQANNEANGQRGLERWSVREYREKQLQSFKKYIWSNPDRNAKLREARLKQQSLKIDTTIELIVKAWLDSWSIPYQHPYRFGNYQVDFAIPEKKFIIHVDGEYWHSLPDMIERDYEEDKFAQEQGWTFVRLFEPLIRNSTVKSALKMQLRAFGYNIPLSYYIAHPYFCRVYGEELQKKIEALGIEVLNPFQRIEQKVYDEIEEKGGQWTGRHKKMIVEGDLEKIREADAVVAYMPNPTLVPTIGTIMEVFYAGYELEKPVFVFADDNPFAVKHPWIGYLTNISTSEEQLLRKLEKWKNE